MTLVVHGETLSAAREFFEDRGSQGFEGTAMIAADSLGHTRLVVPKQVAAPVPYCSVKVTTEGKLELASNLRLGELYVARIHSHPGLAFHSPTDDVNPAITFEGALSIVVPFFGLGLRHGLDSCAVLQRRGGQWIDLPVGPERDRELAVR